MKKIALLGSTGSIGESALAVVRAHPDRFKVVALAAYNNIEKLHAQIREFKPHTVCLYSKEAAAELKRTRSAGRPAVLAGDEGLREIAALPDIDTVICGIVGAKGIGPILSAISAGHDVGIANKEPLVMAGDLIVHSARRKKVRILPIDSEHSAIWQCLKGVNGRADVEIKKLILTASGGPFLGRKRSTLTHITPEEAVRHPRWQMGKKISVDSATLMNKGLEIKEAHHLFNVPIDRIDVLVHPEAVIHSMVEFVDGSHMAQLAINDMKLPIQYALSYPDRLPLNLPQLDLAAIKTLTFDRPDRKQFPCLDLAYEAWQEGGTASAVLNAANEVAVDQFLHQRISFLSIPKVIERVLSRHRLRKNPDLDEIMAADEWARAEAVNV